METIDMIEGNKSAESVNAPFQHKVEVGATIPVLINWVNGTAKVVGFGRIMRGNKETISNKIYFKDWKKDE